MSLYRAFNRTIEQKRAGIPSVRITPTYKLLADEAAVELRKEVAMATPSVVKPEEIRRLVTESQASLLMEEVGRLRGILSDTQAQMQNLMGKFSEYMDLTAKLAEEMGAMAKVREVNARINVGRGRYLRDLQSVTSRWEEWRKLFFSGMSESQIANRFGVDRQTVVHAKNKKWIPSYTMSVDNPKQKATQNKERQE